MFLLCSLRDFASFPVDRHLPRFGQDGYGGTLDLLSLSPMLPHCLFPTHIFHTLKSTTDGSGGL